MLAPALAADEVIVCPAFPGIGRAVFQGYLFVKDQLLSDSPMKDHTPTRMLALLLRGLPASRLDDAQIRDVVDHFDVEWD